MQVGFVVSGFAVLVSGPYPVATPLLTFLLAAKRILDWCGPTRSTIENR